jgi:hypothetical protein
LPCLRDLPDGACQPGTTADIRGALKIHEGEQARPLQNASRR